MLRFCEQRLSEPMPDDAYNRLLRTMGRLAAKPEREPLPLTPREIEVLAYVALGLTNREIGTLLYVSRATVAIYMERIFDKLGVRTRTQAALIGRDKGLI